MAATRQGEAERAISYYRKLAQLDPDNPRWAFQTIRLSALSGFVADAAKEIDAALERWPEDPTLRAFALISGFRTVEQIAPITPTDKAWHIGVLREQQMRQLVHRAPQDCELLRPLMADDKKKDVIIAAAPKADTVVLVFTAMNDVVSMSLPIFDRYLAALGMTAIYVKDFQRSFLPKWHRVAWKLQHHD